MNQGVNLAAICIADGFGVFLTIIMLGANIWKNSRNKVEGKYVRLMLYSAMLSCISDSVAFIFDGKSGIVASVAVYLSNFWLYLSNIVLGSLWILVILFHIIGKNIPKYQIILIACLDFVGAVCLIINFFTPIVFSVSEDNVYARSSLFWLYVAIELVFTLDGIMVYFLLRKTRAGAKYFPIWQFVIPAMIGIVIQSMFYGVSMICPSTTLAICGIILGLFNESEAEAEALRQHEIDTGIILDQKNQLEYQQEQLKEALANAESANRAKTEFLFNMSHDIRTPMNAIMGFNAMAKKNITNPDKTVDYLEKIDISSQQLLTLINQVLEMSRIESGKTEFIEQKVNVRERFNAMVTVVSAQARAKGLEFVSSLEDIEHENVLADDSRMGQITLNIVGNAIKYTNAGGWVRFILKEIPPRRDKYASYTLCVEDTGIGMSKEYLKDIFEPFSREKSSTVSRIQGTGLGMSIVKHLVDIKGGSINVDSEYGKGTKVEITLDFPIIDGATLSAAQSKMDEPEAFENKCVLLVEDNEMNREIARDLLEERGFIVEEAEDGDVAVDMFRASVERGESRHYDFILMDVQMPRMNGYEATRIIRSIPVPDGYRIPIIAMTANVFDEDRRNAIEAGMDEHLAKPVDMVKLLEAFSKFI